MKMIVKAMFLLSLATSGDLLAVGAGSSGGGQWRAEEFKAIGVDLVRLQKNYNALAAIQGSPGENYLDNVTPSELKNLVEVTQVQFFGLDNIKLSNRFDWTNQRLRDNQTGEDDLTAIYVAEQSRIYVSPIKWDEANQVEKYLIVRKEYWRGFSKPDVTEMRAYITSYFAAREQDPKPLIKPELVTKSIDCMGTNFDRITLKVLANGTFELDARFRDAEQRTIQYKLPFPAKQCFWRKHSNTIDFPGRPALENFFHAEIKCGTGNEYVAEGKNYMFDTLLTQRIDSITPPQSGSWSYSKTRIMAELYLQSYPETKPNTVHRSGSFLMCRWL